MTRKRSFHHFVWVGLLLGVFILGCEHGEKGSGFTYGDSSVPKPKPEDEKDPVKTNPFVGTWALTPAAGGAPWYALFYPDGTWRIADDSAGSQIRVYGSYQTNGNQLTGNMVNPNVGKGAISASITDGIMTLDFTEHWHDPHKTVRYTGTKF